VRNFRNITSAFFCAGLAAATPAQAVEWGGAYGGDVRWFDWREYQRGEQLLKETGPLAALLVQLELREGPLFAQLETQWGGGLARYDGRLQTGPSYSADAWEEIIDSQLRLGYRGPTGSVHVGYMQRDWRRFIDGSASVSSAEERYRWRLATFGGDATLPWTSRWRVALNLGLPTESYQKVYTNNADDFTLEPGAGFYWRLSFPFRPGWQRYPGLTLEPYFQQQNMKDSDSVLLTQNGVSLNRRAYQPESYRRELGVTLRWYFAGEYERTAAGK
jgi:hypothetical protein